MPNVYRQFGVPVYLPASTDPTNDNYASPRGYTETKLAKTGGTMQGALTFHNSGTVATVPSGGTLAVASGGDLTIADAPAAGSDAVNKTYADLMLPLTGGMMSGAITLPDVEPSNDLHAIPKRYAEKFGVREARAVATTNITKSGTQTIDGVSLIAGDRVLLTGQTDAAEDGIWVVAAGAWARATDMDASAEIRRGSLFWADEGTAGANSLWALDGPTGALTIGTSLITFTQVGGAGAGVTAGAGLTKSGAVINVVSGNTAIVANTDDITLTLASSSGLEIVSGLKIDLDTGSGLQLGAGGLSIAAAAVTPAMLKGVYSTATHAAGATIVLDHTVAPYQWGILQAFTASTGEPLECTYDCDSTTQVTAYFSSSQAQDTVRFVWIGLA